MWTVGAVRAAMRQLPHHRHRPVGHHRTSWLRRSGRPRTNAAQRGDRMIGSTLDTVPRIFRGTASNAEPTHLPTRSLVQDVVAHQAFLRASSGDYFTWLNHVRPAAGCARPVRLAVHPVDPATGRRL